MTKVKTKGNELLWYPLLKKSPTLHTITEHASQWAMTILKNNVKKIWSIRQKFALQKVGVAAVFF